MAIAGLKGTTTTSWATDDRPKNFREMILWRDPNGMAPLTALMSKMGEESTDDPEFAWYEEELRPIRVQLSAQIVTAGVTGTLFITGSADALDLVAGDLLLAEKLEVAGSFGFEIVEVTSDPTVSNSIILTRSSSGTTADTIATSSWLLKMGSAFEEGAASPKSSSRKSAKLFNYTQIFKTSFNLTNTAIATRFRSGDPVQNDKKRKMFDHSAAMEQAFLFGYKKETTGTAAQPKRYTGGLYQFLQDHYNATDSPTVKIWTTTAVTQNDILDAVYKIFDYGYTGAGNERIGLCGNGMLNYLNKIVLAGTSTRVNYDGQIDYFGMKLQKWIFPQGTIYLRSHPLMNVNSRFTNGMFLINPAGIKYRYLKGRDTKAQDNIQANDADQLKGQWLSEVGVEFHHLRSMMYMAIQV